MTCNIELLEIDGNLESFSATYQDCNGNTGSVTIVLLEENLYSASGINTENLNFETEFKIGEEFNINPTKVFKFVAKILKKYLCPECT